MYNKNHYYCFEKKQIPEKIASYKRLIAEILASLLSIFVIVSINENESFEKMNVNGMFFAILIFVVLSEGIFIFDSLVAKKYPWHEALSKRVIALLVFVPLWLIFIGYIGKIVRPLFIPDETLKDNSSFALGITILVLFVTIYVSALIAANYHKSLKFFILENEKLRQEKLQMDYFALQDQLNPHFLFNNLSTLMAIIPEDQGKALNFTENFTDVYRYVLKSSKNKLISLKEEISFIKAYLGLHKERLGNGFSYSIKVEEEELDTFLPPLSLQYLVENAIKHNVATESQPLILSITSKTNRLVVSNNFQPKSSTYSTNTGLTNLQKRYEYLSLKNQIEIFNSSEIFTVSIPLIDKNYDHGL